MIRVRGLCKRYHGAEVLRGLDFELASGAVAAIIGPSGGGKSTFLRALNGLDPHDEGTITVDGAELPPRAGPAHLRAIRQKVGFVFQQFHLFPHLTALQNVALAPMRVLGLPREDAEARGRALLARVHLAHKADALPRALSGGQQQRVAIARTLAMAPSVVLLDEPTSALDPRMAGEVSTVIRELAAEGQSMIVVTHSMSLAAVAHNVSVFADGRNVETGPPEQIFGAPTHAVTRAFVEAELRRPSFTPPPAPRTSPPAP